MGGQARTVTKCNIEEKYIHTLKGEYKRQRAFQESDISIIMGVCQTTNSAWFIRSLFFFSSVNSGQIYVQLWWVNIPNEAVGYIDWGGNCPLRNAPG